MELQRLPIRSIADPWLKGRFADLDVYLDQWIETIGAERAAGIAGVQVEDIDLREDWILRWMTDHRPSSFADLPPMCRWWLYRDLPLAALREQLGNVRQHPLHDHGFRYNDQYPFAHAWITASLNGQPEYGWPDPHVASINAEEPVEICIRCVAIMPQVEQPGGRVALELQARAYHIMAITGAPRVHFGIWVLGAERPFYAVVERNEDEIDRLMAKEREFYQRVLDRREAQKGARHGKG